MRSKRGSHVHPVGRTLQSRLSAADAADLDLKLLRARTSTFNISSNQFTHAFLLEISVWGVVENFCNLIS